MMYIDYTRPPFIDYTLPSAITLPSYQLIILHSAALLLDYILLHNERQLQCCISGKQIRLVMTLYHIMIPMIFISNSPPCNLLFAAVPWFIASYSVHMRTDQLTLKAWSETMVAITREDNTDEQYTATKRRLKGAATIALGIFKLAFSQLFIDPLLPNHSEYALEYPWLHPLSMIYTILYGVKAYCVLGAIEIFLGLQQLVFGWKIIDLNNYPILSVSPRDFWSRRWNRVIRNLFHTQIFEPTKETVPTEINHSEQFVAPLISTEIDQKFPEQKPPEQKPRVTRRVTRSAAKAAAAAASAAAAAVVVEESHKEEPTKKVDIIIEPKIEIHDISPPQPSFWSTRRGRGLLSFIVSGVFHELIIMSTCRKLTLEQFAFFTVEGILTMLEVDLRQGVFKQEPTGKTRIICIIVHIFSLAIIGRLFTGPFLRYGFLN